MSFFDDLAQAAANVANTVIQVFVPGAPPIPPPPVPPILSDQQSHGASAVNPPPSPGSQSRPPTTNNDRFIVLDLIDLLQKPPPKITPEYIRIVQRVSSWVGAAGVVNTADKDSRNAWQLSLFPEQSAGSGFGTTMSGPDLSSQETIRNAVSKARNDVLDVSTQVQKIIATSVTFGTGFIPSQNPFTQASMFNAGRLGYTAVSISDQEVADIAGNMRIYLDLLNRQTGIWLDQQRDDAAQLSSATLSLEGFGGSGNTSVDLGRITPEQEAIKRQKALEALSVLDFKKRVPRVLFTAFYQPSENRAQGIIVGLKRVPDASGYVITRRNIFEDKVTRYTVSNADMTRDTTRLASYVQTWILSFYDSVQKDQVITYLDTDYQPHRYYYYTVQAYQLQNTNVGSMFTTELAPAPFSQAQKAEMRRQISLLEPSGPDQVSPYPIISQQLFGTPDNDWLLAALNTRASINRSEPKSQTRKYAYLSAQMDFLFAQADAGLFMVPKGRDFDPVKKNISDAISRFGVNQVIQNLLQETGAIFHFDGTEPNEDSLFTKVGTIDPDQSSLLLTVASAIDPETATLNMQTLASNMPTLTSGQVTLKKTQFVGNLKNTGFGGAQSQEIAVPGDVDGAPEINATSDIQFLQKVGNTSLKPVDLTTPEGLGTLMRAIRIYADQDGSRGLQMENNAKLVVRDRTDLKYKFTNNPAQPVVPSGQGALPPPPPAGSTSNDPVTVAGQIATNLAQGNVGGAIDAAKKAAEKAAKDAEKALSDAFKGINIKL